MKVVAIRAFGGPEAAEVLEMEARDPGEGEARVRIMFAGLNAIDVHVARGSFAGADRQVQPTVLGFEGAGEVESVGAGVSSLKPGDRVAWCGVPGALAEYATVAAWQLVSVPDNIPLDIACALQLDGTLAHALTVSAFPVRANDWLLVQGAETTASQLLVQIAKAQGAQVVATVAGEAAVATLRAAGADHVFVLGGDIPEKVREATGGRYCNAVFDSVGQSTIASSIACCRRRGVVVLHGALQAPVASVSPDALAAAGSIFVTRLHLPDFMQDETEVRWRTTDLFDAWKSSHLQIPISRVVQIEAVRDALMALEKSPAAGKVLVKQ